MLKDIIVVIVQMVTIQHKTIVFTNRHLLDIKRFVMWVFVRIKCFGLNLTLNSNGNLFNIAENVKTIVWITVDKLCGS